MTAFAENGALGGFELDRATHTVRFQRLVSASAGDVFSAWTQPEAVTAWWDPDGRPLVRCDIDLRPGGSFSFVNAGHSAHPFAGTYTEIAPPNRLVFEALGATGRVLLRESGGATEMIVEIECRSAEQLDQFVRMGVAAGTAQTLDNLVAFANRRLAAVG